MNNCTPVNFKCKDSEPFLDGKNFTKILKSFDKVAFMPGVRADKEIIDTHDYRYLKSGLFRANLHIHSQNSDGMSRVERLLTHANAIAKRNHDLFQQPFVIAVTDHDTLEGAKEVYNLVCENKLKYQYLKIALGLEISALGNTFKNQIKPVTLHTLAYCIDPFDEILNEFIERKKRLKLELTKKTIKKLNKELAPFLNEFAITFTLEDAAKIHEMVIKGEDETCRPLKKYTTAKILFEYYTKDIPKSNDFNYEKPVQIYKQSFRRKSFQPAYISALEKYLASKTARAVKLNDVPPYITDAINLACSICDKAHPSMTEMPPAFSSFEETLKLLAGLNNGLICIAHPARIEVEYINGDIGEFYRELFQKFTDIGGGKACLYEGYYQSYEGREYSNLLPVIDAEAEKFNLIPTGGMDSHGPDIITRCPYT